MLAGNVPLPCVAARIPAAHSGLDLSCPCGSITCNALELACDLHYSQSGMWISTTLGIGTVHISGGAIFP